MSGLMLGIMLSRPLSSFIAEIGQWHYIFSLSSLIMLFVLILLFLYLPLPITNDDDNLKQQSTSYTSLLKSMIQLFKEKDVLRERSYYQACLFGSFCLFWTSVPLYLAQSSYQFNHKEIALFALVGVSGAIVAPFAGNAADAGKTKIVTFTALLLAVFSYLITHLFTEGTLLGVILMVFCAIFLDAAVTLSMVTGQRAVFAIAPHLRSRLNGVYVSFIFIGGGLGSALGAWSIDAGGWVLASTIGAALPSIAFLYFLFKTKSKENFTINSI